MREHLAHEASEPARSNAHEEHARAERAHVALQTGVPLSAEFPAEAFRSAELRPEVLQIEALRGAEFPVEAFQYAALQHAVLRSEAATPSGSARRH